MSMATLPEAQAASWRAVGMPDKAGLSSGRNAPRCPCLQYSSAAKLPTCATSTSLGSMPAAASPADTASCIIRSEERRVGKEGSVLWLRDHEILDTHALDTSAV